jgi:hypothetical protein
MKGFLLTDFRGTAADVACEILALFDWLTGG